MKIEKEYQMQQVNDLEQVKYKYCSELTSLNFDKLIEEFPLDEMVFCSKSEMLNYIENNNIQKGIFRYTLYENVKMFQLRKKIRELQYTVNRLGVRGLKRTFYVCKHCQSKIAIKLMTDNACPVCGGRFALTKEEKHSKKELQEQIKGLVEEYNKEALLYPENILYYAMIKL